MSDVGTQSLFALPEELEEFRRTVQAFGRDVVAPLVDEAEAEERFPEGLFEQAGELGLIGLQYPEVYGGSAAGILPDAIVREELSYVSVGLGAGIGTQSQVGTAYLERFGTEEQKQRWLVPALAGTSVNAFGVTEPDAGSDVRRIRTTAKRVGDGWILNGRKTFITNAPIADVIGVVAKLEGEKDRFGVFMVETSDAGYECERTLEKMGSRSSEVGELSFTDVRLDDDRRLSPDGGSDIQHILDVLIKGRVLIAAASIGTAQAAFDLGLAYAKERHAFGRPIGRFQEISMKFAEADTQIAAARLLTYKAGHLCDIQDEIPIRECAHAKLFASEMAVSVVDQMMRVFGGAGFMKEMPIERIFRDVRLFPIVEGTTEIQHRILSRQLGL